MSGSAVALIPSLIQQATEQSRVRSIGFSELLVSPDDDLRTLLPEANNGAKILLFPGEHDVSAPQTPLTVEANKVLSITSLAGKSILNCDIVLQPGAQVYFRNVTLSGSLTVGSAGVPGGVALASLTNCEVRLRSDGTVTSNGSLTLRDVNIVHSGTGSAAVVVNNNATVTMKGSNSIVMTGDTQEPTISLDSGSIISEGTLVLDASRTGTSIRIRGTNVGILNRISDLTMVERSADYVRAPIRVVSSSTINGNAVDLDNTSLVISRLTVVVYHNTEKTGIPVVHSVDNEDDLVNVNDKTGEFELSVPSLVIAGANVYEGGLTNLTAVLVTDAQSIPPPP